MKEVLKFNIKSVIYLFNFNNIYSCFTQIILFFSNFKNGLMSSLPFLSCFIFINISSLLGDRILKANVISRKNVRKIFNGIGNYN